MHEPAQEDVIHQALRTRVLSVLDEGISRPGLPDDLARRLVAIDRADATGWVASLLPSASAQSVPPMPDLALRALVGDLLYEHGLAADRVSDVLSPHVGTWSPPARREIPASLLSPRDLATPADLASSYDAVVIGSGAGGGMAAQTLAEAGMRILVVERGEYPAPSDLMGDHLRTPRASTGLFPLTGPGADAEPRAISIGDGPMRDVPARDWLWNNNAMTLGGGTRVFGAQAWRFVPQDFAMASTYGVPEGSALADWPITYADLEPYYSRVEQELGVSGGPFTDPWAGPRSAPLPMPALGLSPLGSRLAAAAGRIGLHTQPVPLLVNSREHGGRGACVRCSQCIGFDCPVAARAGSHNTTLPRAAASGNATILPGAQASRILLGPNGRARAVEIVGEAPEGKGGGTSGVATGGLTFLRRDDGGRLWRRTIEVGMVVLAAGAIESARLLLDSATPDHPHGLGNDHDQVGRHLQGHSYGGASALFEEEIVDLRGPGPSVSTADHRHGNEGIIGGGILADEFVPTPASAQRALYETGLVDPATPVGSASMERAMLRFARVMGPIQEVTTASSRVRVDTGRRDRFGRSIVQLSGSLHAEDLRGREMLIGLAERWLEEAGASRVVRMRPMSLPVAPSGGQHQAGTLRMGTDPATSATTPDGRLWGHENIVVADGSTHVTNGGVNPVLTILANSLRVSEKAARG